MPVLVAVLMLTGMLFGQELTPLLQYDRLAILDGQWWRLWTGHLLHTNGWHLLMNLAGLTVIVLLHRPYYQLSSFVFLLLTGFLLISLALLFWSPAISLYVGLSGFLHALLVWGACQDIRAQWSSGWLILAGVAVKVSWEQWQGASAELVTLIEADVATDAHLYGAISGVLLFAITFSARQLWQREPA